LAVVIAVDTRKKGRPTDSPKDHMLRVRMNADTLKKLDDVAHTMEITRSEAVRLAIVFLEKDNGRGDTMKIRKSVIINAIESAKKPLNFEEIADSFVEQIDFIDLHVVLAEMVARKRLSSFVDDDGRVVYEINY